MVLAWIAKDVVLYPFVRRAYEPGAKHGALELVGREGVARSELSPNGQVRVGSEIWRAESADGARIAEGAPVRVIGASGFVLRVRVEEPGVSASGSQPLVTIVLPWLSAWRGADGPDLLLASVQSVLDQTEKSIEILIVTDAEADRVTPCLPGDSRVAQVSLPRASLVELLNGGFELARGEAMKVLPAGDRLAPACLDRQLAMLEARPDLAAVLCGAELVDEWGAPIDREADSEHVAVACALLRPRMLRNVGSLGAAFEASTDRDLWRRLLPASQVASSSDRLVRLRWPRLRRSDRRAGPGW